MAEDGGEVHTTPDVFVSYSSQDAAVAEAIVEALEHNGLRCWIAPRNVTPGASYAGQIIHAIDAAKASVLILSQNAASSPHVLREVERAASKRHSIISLRIDQAPLPADFEYFLNTSHWLDTSAADIGRTLPKLLAAVQLALRAPAAMPAGTATAHDPAPPASARSTNRTAIVVASAVGLAVVGFAADRLWLSTRRASAPPTPTPVGSASIPATAALTIPEKSIAVLPFVDLSEKHDQEYFADGMAEEILDLLAKIPAIKVIGRTSSFQFKGKNEDLRTIGARLGAAFIVEGSVRKSGDQIRVTAQLIGTDNGVHRWSESYDRDMDDVLKLQDEIATGIARALEVTVGADRPSSKATVQNVEAYNLYLRGRHATDRYDPEGLGEAVDYFQQALDLDPTLAVAAASLGAARVFQAISGFVPVREAYDRARRECALALKLDPQLAGPHATLGTILLIYDWDWTAADSEIKKALSLEARNPIALDAAAVLASIRGQHDEALRLVNSLLAADPLNPRAHFWLGYWLYQSGRLTDSARSFEDTLRISPTYADAQYYLTLTLLSQGEKEKALHLIERASDESERLAGLSIVHSAMGHKAKSDAALAALTKGYADQWAFGIASVHAFRGERDEALAWLDRAVTQRDEDLIDIKAEPLIAGLHADPRYKAILRKMKLPEQ